MKERPKKIILSKNKQKTIFEKAKAFVMKDLLPNPKINKIIVFGSIAKGTYGRYIKPYKHRSYSDVDFLVFVENEFNAPKTWNIHYSGKLYSVYNRIKLEHRILIQYMICKKKSYSNKNNQKEAEKWGAPLALEKSKNKHFIIYEK